MKPLLLSLVFVIAVAACKNAKTDKETKPDTSKDVITETPDKKIIEPEKEKQVIIGRWRPFDIIIKNMSDQEKKSMKEDLVLEFRDNNIFNAYNKGAKQAGKYTFDSKENKLTITYDLEGGNPENFTTGWENELLLMTNDEGTVKLKRQ